MEEFGLEEEFEEFDEADSEMEDEIAAEFAESEE